MGKTSGRNVPYPTVDRYIRVHGRVATSSVHNKATRKVQRMCTLKGGKSSKRSSQVCRITWCRYFLGMLKSSTYTTCFIKSGPHPLKANFLTNTLMSFSFRSINIWKSYCQNTTRSRFYETRCRIPILILLLVE